MPTDTPGDLALPIRGIFTLNPGIPTDALMPFALVLMRKSPPKIERRFWYLIMMKM